MLSWKFFNSSPTPIRTIQFEGVNTGFKTNVDWYIAPYQTETFNFSVSKQVLSKDNSARLKFYEYGYAQGRCLDYYTEDEQKRDLIFNNCIVAKTKNGGAVWAARKACKTIADNPSFLDRLRFGR